MCIGGCTNQVTLGNALCNGNDVKVFFMEYTLRMSRSVIPKNKKVFYRQLLGYITRDLCKLGLTHRIVITY